MASYEAPAVARRRLRLALRKAREAKGLTQAQVAESLDWSLSKVNRIETGEVTVSTTDLHALLRLFGVVDPAEVDRLVADARASRRRGWWDEPRYRQHLTPAMLQLFQFEAEATTIRVFHPTLIPGLLQTRAYAEAVLAVWRDRLDEAVRATRLEARLQRRGHVFGRPDPPRYLLILDESVLYRRLGGTDVMIEQLRELLALTRQPYLALRVVPLADTAVMAMLGVSSILDLGDDENAVLYREGVLQDEIIHNPDDVAYHRQLFDQIWRTALPEDASARMVEAHVEALSAGVDPRSRITGQ